MDRIKIYDSRSDRIILAEPVNKTAAEWKELLTPQQYEVTTEQGTERPFTCTYEEIKQEGLYRCVRCGTDLFRASSKFESDTGWPSYYEPVSELNIRLRPDTAFGVNRTEVLCARCGSHLGHVFNDGPPPTYKRFCINGAALKFVSQGLPV